MCNNKVCKKCNNEWPTEIFFNKHNLYKDGYNAICKGCETLQRKKKEYDGSKKTCLICKKEKTTLEFSYASNSKDTFRTVCRTCWIEQNMESNLKRDPNYIEKIRKKSDEVYKQHVKQLSNNSRKRNAVSTIFKSAKSRSKRREIDFNISLEDIIIPEVCPVLKIPIKWGDKLDYSNSPSLDRIITEKGYTQGNVQVISSKANTMKSNATPEELLNFADWIYKTFKK